MRYQDIKLVEEIRLDEINMSPSSLQRLAGAVDARAGMEFEMIVPNVGSVDDDGGDLEPDYDQDESVVSINDACNFFYDGDYNGRRDIANLRDSMQQDFEEWAREQFDDYWADNDLELIREYLTLNANDRDIIEILELAGGEAEEVEENGATKADYTAAAERIMKELDSSSWYDEARDAAQSDYLNDGDREEEWLNSAGLGSMADIENRYQITWPHWHNPYEGTGEYNIEQVASDFEDAIGKSVHHSTRYHGAHRSPTAYSLEPDGSLDPDDSDDTGLEFISPPMPVNEMLADLKKVKAWADNRGCYTNKSTGLHINVSVPGFSIEKLDYVKLALLLGDEYVLKEFGRSSNTYTKSALGIVKKRVGERPEDAKALLDQMKNHLGAAASKAIHTGNTDKYTSINTKSGYIEFRSPGGDWLNDNFDKIENTLLRFVVAMDAAIDPEKYRDEYLKKLYKILEPKGTKDTIAYFAQYVAGEIPKAALRSFVKQVQLERKIAKDPTGGQRYWWRVGLRSNPNYEIEVVGSSAAEAIDAAMDANEELMRYNRNTDFTTRPIRPYSDAPVKATVGEPQAIGQQGSTTTGNWGVWVPALNRWATIGNAGARRFANREGAQTWIQDYNDRHPGNELELEVREIEPGRASSSRNTLSQTDIENRLGWPDQTGDANYEVVDRRTQQPVFKFVANTDQDAQRKYSQFLDVMMLPHDTENYGYREIALPGSTVDIQRQRAAHNRVAVDNLFGEFDDEGPGQQYKIIRMSDRSLLTVVRASSQQEAEAKAAQVFRFNGLDPDLYDVFPVSGEGYEVVPQPPGRGSEIIPGMWDILIDGQQVFRVPAATQAEANQSARQWLSQRSPEFNREHQGGEVEVVPARREA